MPEGNRYIIQLIDRYSPVMRKIAASTKKFSDRLGSVQGAVGGIGGALAIGAIGRTLLRFEKAMNQIIIANHEYRMADKNRIKALEVLSYHVGFKVFGIQKTIFSGGSEPWTGYVMNTEKFGKITFKAEELVNQQKFEAKINNHLSEKRFKLIASSFL